MDNSIRKSITTHARVENRSSCVKKDIDVATRFIAEKMGVLKKIQSDLKIPREREIPKGRGITEWIAEEFPDGSIVTVEQVRLAYQKHCTRQENNTALAKSNR